MSPPTTTVVLILLAGDQCTADQLDPLLREFQAGVNNWPRTTAPTVLCFYYRWNKRCGRIETWYYQIQSGTLRFKTDGTLDLALYPPAGAVSLSPQDDIVLQVTAFLRYVRSVHDQLPHPGPIRVVIGAHGFAGVGVWPTPLLERLWFLWRLLTSPFDKSLRHHSWTDRWLILSRRLFSSQFPPGGILLQAKSTAPQLRLDDAAKAFETLPPARLKTLVLHTCSLSCIEAMASLHQFPHHIACESILSSFLRASQWFSTFADPSAKIDEITRACFNSLASTKNSNGTFSTSGCFSSHTTDDLDGFFCDLNDLGKQLYKILLDSSDTNGIGAIAMARLYSEVDPSHVDFSHFCELMKSADIVPSALLDSLVKTLRDRQHQSPLKTNEWNGAPVQGDYKGISVFFPDSVISTPFTTNDLPKSFLNRVPDWRLFLDTWVRR